MDFTHGQLTVGHWDGTWADSDPPDPGCVEVTVRVHGDPSVDIVGPVPYQVSLSRAIGRLQRRAEPCDVCVVFTAKVDLTVYVENGRARHVVLSVRAAAAR